MRTSSSTGTMRLETLFAKRIFSKHLNLLCKIYIYEYINIKDKYKYIRQPRAATASSASAMTEMAATLAKGERVFEKILKRVFEARM